MSMKGKLHGKTILNIRPLEKALPLAMAVEREGGRCIVLPSIEIRPVSPMMIKENDLVGAGLRARPLDGGRQIAAPTEIEQIGESDFWVFVSQYAVKYAFGDFPPNKKHPRIIAIGKATAEALQKANIPIDILPEESSSEGLLQLPAFQSLHGKTITIFRGKNGRTLLDDMLKQRGAMINEVISYERVMPQWTQKDYALLDNKIDLALGLSLDSLTYFFSKLQWSHAQRFFDVPWLVMSHRIAEEAKKLGIKTIYTISDSNVFESLIRCCCLPDR